MVLGFAKKILKLATPRNSDVLSTTNSQFLIVDQKLQIFLLMFPISSNKWQPLIHSIGKQLALILLKPLSERLVLWVIGKIPQKTKSP